MYKVYSEFFSAYLSICKKMYNPDRPYDNLEKCVKQCEHSYWMLAGMLELLEKSKAISQQQAQEEGRKLADTFSTIRLFNAYEDHGEIMVLVHHD